MTFSVLSGRFLPASLRVQQRQTSVGQPLAVCPSRFPLHFERSPSWEAEMLSWSCPFTGAEIYFSSVGQLMAPGSAESCPFSQCWNVLGLCRPLRVWQCCSEVCCYLMRSRKWSCLKGGCFSAAALLIPLKACQTLSLGSFSMEGILSLFSKKTSGKPVQADQVCGGTLLFKRQKFGSQQFRANLFNERGSCCCHDDETFQKHHAVHLGSLGGCQKHL